MHDEMAFLFDMLSSATRVQQYIAGKTYQHFLADPLLQDAVVLRLSIIGEAAKRISTATRSSLPALPFDNMARMRDRLVHVYWRVDYQIVWDTATTHVPELIKHLQPRLQGAPPPGKGVGP